MQNSGKKETDKVYNTATAAMMAAFESGGDPAAITAAAVGVATGVVPDEAVAAAVYAKAGAAIGSIGGPPGAVVGGTVGAVLGATKNSPYAPSTFVTVVGAIPGALVGGPVGAAITATLFGALSAHQSGKFHETNQVCQELSTAIEMINSEKFIATDNKGQAVKLPIEDVNNIKKTLSSDLFKRSRFCSGSTMFRQTKKEITDCLLYSDALKSIISSEFK